MTIAREEAIAQVVDDLLIKMSVDERIERLESMMCEDWSSDPGWNRLPHDVRDDLDEQVEIENAADPRYDPPLRMTLRLELSRASNEYLSRSIADQGRELQPVRGEEPQLVACPCCGLRSLDERGQYDICSVCWWEDDGQDNDRADRESGGPNGRLSLTQGRINFLKFGISDPMRTDLRQNQDPVFKYAQGRLFELSSDGLSVAEPAAGWTGQVENDEVG